MSDTLNPTACQRLQQADQAYHDLMTGALARSIQDENGESVSFTQASKADLLSYIQMLAPLCPTYCPTAIGTGTSNIRRPLRFVF